MQKLPMIILTGPTVVGKTRLSLALAGKIGGEIISADSMQVYRHMDIGSAKIKPEEMMGIPHHLIDVLEPFEAFDVVTFQSMAKESLAGIYSRGNIPIITGGTGFYIQALLYDINFEERASEDKEYREYLTDILKEKGELYLHSMLEKADPESAEVIHPNNRKRVIRALEYYNKTGEKISLHNKREQEKPSPYNYCYFVLNDERSKLYEGINRRVDKMLAAGLVEEVRRLQDMGCKKHMVSMQGLGYKETLSYLEGDINLEDAVRLIKGNTRHFAKRQLTWFKRERDVIWVNKSQFCYEEENILSFLCDKLRETSIIKL